MKALTATIAAIAVAACGERAPTIENAADPSSPTPAGQIRPTPAAQPSPDASESASPTRPVAPRSRERSCELTVDGNTLVRGRCLVFPSGEGYTLNTWDQGKPKQSHFAVVNADSATQGEAYWNSDPDDTKANDRLGTVRKGGDCWVNARVRICAK